MSKVKVAIIGSGNYSATDLMVNTLNSSGFLEMNVIAVSSPQLKLAGEK